MDTNQFQPINLHRVRLRNFTDADQPIFLAYRSDPEVARYQRWESVT